MRAGTALRAALAGAALAVAGGAQAEVCSHTVFSTPFMTGCAGAFAGTLDGSAAELAALGAAFGDGWVFMGRSDDADFGPFVANPQVAFNGALAFDVPITGRFVLGLVSAGQHSFYSFTTKRRIGELGFDSLEGVATTPQGNPFPLDYAVLYMATAAVPEPGTWALWTAGLAALVGLKRRRG